jgi:hypothetical protein
MMEYPQKMQKARRDPRSSPMLQHTQNRPEFSPSILSDPTDFAE